MRGLRMRSLPAVPSLAWRIERPVRRAGGRLPKLLTSRCDQMAAESRLDAWAISTPGAVLAVPAYALTIRRGGGCTLDAIFLRSENEQIQIGIVSK